MSATIYAVPDGIKKPDIFAKNWEEQENEYIAKVKALAIKRSKDNPPEVGKEIRFQVADGYARYIVMSMKPLEIIHLQVGDAWDWQYADLLTPDKVREVIRQDEAMQKLFSKNK